MSKAARRRSQKAGILRFVFSKNHNKSRQTQQLFIPDLIRRVSAGI